MPAARPARSPGTDFVAERAATYVSQQDTHIAEMTVAETLSFASESLGPGLSKQLHDVMRARELEAGVEPDPDLERLWVATFTQSRKNVLVEMFAKLLGLDHVMVGDGGRGGGGGVKQDFQAKTAGPQNLPINKLCLQVGHGVLVGFEVAKHLTQANISRIGSVRSLGIAVNINAIPDVSMFVSGLI